MTLFNFIMLIEYVLLNHHHHFRVQIITSRLRYVIWFNSGFIENFKFFLNWIIFVSITCVEKNTQKSYLQRWQHPPFYWGLLTLFTTSQKYKHNICRFHVMVWVFSPKKYFKVTHLKSKNFCYWLLSIVIKHTWVVAIKCEPVGKCYWNSYLY